MKGGEEGEERAREREGRVGGSERRGEGFLKLFFEGVAEPVGQINSDHGVLALTE